MRILLDECLPRKLKRDLPGHDVATVPEMGWASIKNGKLLKLAKNNFDVFLTADQNLEYQQNLDAYQIAVIVLITHDIRLKALRYLIPELLRALETVQVGDLVHVSA